MISTLLVRYVRLRIKQSGQYHFFPTGITSGNFSHEEKWIKKLLKFSLTN